MRGPHETMAIVAFLLIGVVCGLAAWADDEGWRNPRAVLIAGFAVAAVILMGLSYEGF
jgi:hypothetical protein